VGCLAVALVTVSCIFVGSNKILNAYQDFSDASNIIIDIFDLIVTTASNAIVTASDASALVDSSTCTGIPESIQSQFGSNFTVISDMATTIDNTASPISNSMNTFVSRIHRIAVQKTSIVFLSFFFGSICIVFLDAVAFYFQSLILFRTTIMVTWWLVTALLVVCSLTTLIIVSESHISIFYSFFPTN
jgi:hypothetical protein